MKKDSLLSISLIIRFSGYKVSVYKNLNEAMDKILGLEKTSSFCELLIADIPVSPLTDKDFVNKRSKLNRTFTIYMMADFVDTKMRKKYEKGFLFNRKNL